MPTNKECLACKKNIYKAIGTRVPRWVLLLLVSILGGIGIFFGTMLNGCNENVQANAVKIAVVEEKTDDLKDDVNEIKKDQKTALEILQRLDKPK